MKEHGSVPHTWATSSSTAKPDSPKAFRGIASIANEASFAADPGSGVCSRETRAPYEESHELA